MTWAIREKRYSQRHACRLVGLHPKTYRYVTKRSGDEDLRGRLRELASQRRRFGYRRLGLMLERQGIKLSPKKLYRLYREERQAAEGGRRSEPRQGDAAGRPPPKALRPVRKRKLVDEMRGDWDVSIRRACRVFLVDTSTYHYKSRRPGQAALEQRIKEICQTRVRYGYRRVHVMNCTPAPPG